MYLPTVEVLKLHVSPDASRLLSSISRFLDEQGVPSYLVGGFVRDALLGRPTADIDIAVDGAALAVAAAFAAASGGSYVPLDDDRGTGRVVMPDRKLQVDFTTIRGHNIEADLAERDFTVNAIAIKTAIAANGAVSPGDIIDPFFGEVDLRRRIVRAVGETVFADDAARLLRAVRLAAELDFSIEAGTEALIRRDSSLVAGVAGERAREELLRLLALPGAGHRLAYLDELGLLTALIPEMEAARGVSQPTVHVWDVLRHSIETVGAVEFVLHEAGWEHAAAAVLEMVPWSAEMSAHFSAEVGHGSTRRSLLKLAALLHDIAKPATKTMDGPRARFIGHPQQGAEAAAAVMERLRFSAKEIKQVEIMVRHHLRPLQMTQDELPSRRAIYRYFRDTGDAGIDILYLCLADHLATRGDGLDMAQWRYHTRMTQYVLEKHRDEANLSRPVKLVDGHAIMEIFGLQPGPAVGELLEALRETQAAGEVSTREEALDYIKILLAARAEAPRNEANREEK